MDEQTKIAKINEILARFLENVRVLEKKRGHPYP